MAERLTDEVQQGLEGSEWTREGDSIVRELELDAAMAFVTGGRAGEAANHHPDILIHGWNSGSAQHASPMV